MMQKLGDIATYINGYAFKPADRGLKGLPIIRIQDLTGNSYDLGFYDGIYPKKIEINNGDILISWSGSLGIFLWNGGKALLNQHIFKVIPKINIKNQHSPRLSADFFLTNEKCSTKLPFITEDGKRSVLQNKKGV